MYLVKILCVLLAFLGTLDNCRVSGAPPSQSIASLGAAAQSHLGQDKKYQKQPSLPQRTPVTAVPFEQYFRQNEDGTYEYRHALPNGGMHTEQSYKVLNGDTVFYVVRGFYSYQLPSGKFLTVYYTADENGYRQTSSSVTLRLPEVLQL